MKLDPLLVGAAGAALNDTRGILAAAAAWEAADAAAAAAGGLLVVEGLPLSESVLKLLLLLRPAAAAADFAVNACWSAACCAKAVPVTAASAGVSAVAAAVLDVAVSVSELSADLDRGLAASHEDAAARQSLACGCCAVCSWSGSPRESSSCLFTLDSRADAAVAAAVRGEGGAPAGGRHCLCIWCCLLVTLWLCMT